MAAAVGLGRRLPGAKVQRAPLESTVEEHLRRGCNKQRFMCLKFVSPARNGVPDRVIITPAETVFVEVKRPGEKLRKLQLVTHERMRRAGATIFVVDSIAAVDALLERLLKSRLTLNGTALGGTAQSRPLDEDPDQRATA